MEMTSLYSHGNDKSVLQAVLIIHGAFNWGKVTSTHFRLFMSFLIIDGDLIENRQERMSRSNNLFHDVGLVFT